MVRAAATLASAFLFGVATVCAQPGPSPAYDQPDPELAKLDFGSLIAIKSAADAVATRSNLIQLIFSTPTLPPDGLIPVSGPFAASSVLPGADGTVTTWRVPLPYGIDTLVRQFTPPGNRHAVNYIWLQGHVARLADDSATILSLMNAGYQTWTISMPCLGDSTCPPRISDPRLGIVETRGNHSTLKLLRSATFNPLSIFAKPWIATINTIRNLEPAAGIAVAGLSGGGWSTTLHAAIDPRVRWSYPIAGTAPTAFWSRPPIVFTALFEAFDYEQSDPELLGTAGYLDMYVLGASGTGRRQVQILNRYDSCCFNGVNADLYSQAVVTRVQQMAQGGSWDLVIDGSLVNGHAVPAIALQLMTAEPLSP